MYTQLERNNQIETKPKKYTTGLLVQVDAFISYRNTRNYNCFIKYCIHYGNITGPIRKGYSSPKEY